MTTAHETRQAMAQAGEHWLIPLMDFVDDFRRHRDPAAIARPFALTEGKLDALLAGVIEYLCREARIPEPAWLADVPPAPQPWFVSGLENLKAIALAESPLPFRMRRIFVLANFLQRV